MRAGAVAGTPFPEKGAKKVLNRRKATRFSQKRGKTGPQAGRAEPARMCGRREAAFQTMRLLADLANTVCRSEMKPSGLVRPALYFVFGCAPFFCAFDMAFRVTSPIA
jgi:hypothetical protein